MIQFVVVEFKTGELQQVGLAPALVSYVSLPAPMVLSTSTDFDDYVLDASTQNRRVYISTRLLYPDRHQLFCLDRSTAGWNLSVTSFKTCKEVYSATCFTKIPRITPMKPLRKLALSPDGTRMIELCKPDVSSRPTSPVVIANVYDVIEPDGNPTFVLTNYLYYARDPVTFDAHTAAAHIDVEFSPCSRFVVLSMFTAVDLEQTNETFESYSRRQHQFHDLERERQQHVNRLARSGWNAAQQWSAIAKCILLIGAESDIQTVHWTELGIWLETKNGYTRLGFEPPILFEQQVVSHNVACDQWSDASDHMLHIVLMRHGGEHII